VSEQEDTARQEHERLVREHARMAGERAALQRERDELFSEFAERRQALCEKIGQMPACPTCGSRSWWLTGTDPAVSG
jgi:hypothetical protein